VRRREEKGRRGGEERERQNSTGQICENDQEKAEGAQCEEAKRPFPR